MKVQVEELSSIERKLSIEVEATQVADELSRAYLALGRQVKIAGFRPGKVPRRILEQRFKEQVEDDVLRRMVQRAYLDAIREHKVEAVSEPRVTPGPLKSNEPFSFQAHVEVKPKLDPKDYQALELKKIEVKIEESEVDERLQALRDRAARVEPVEGRDVAQAKDLAVVDFDATVDGKPFEGSKAEALTAEVAPGELVNSRIAALEGVKIGDTKEIDYAFPQDYQVESLRGKTAHFKIQLKGLKQRVVPELNDEFAKEIQGGETLAALKAQIRADLERSQKNRDAGDERAAIFKALIAKNPFEVPHAMVERALDSMIDGALRMMAQSGIDESTLQNLDFNRLREEMREKATSEVQGSLLLEAIAEKEKIASSDEEVDKRVEEMALESRQNLPQVRKLFRDPDRRAGLVLRLREEKTIEFLKSHARYS